VVPTIREASIELFLEQWAAEFNGHRVIVVEDNPQRTFALPAWVEHYSWQDIDERLGDGAWIIPRRSDCVRSFGYYLAAQEECDFVVTLDDDCYPESYYKPRSWVSSATRSTGDGMTIAGGARLADACERAGSPTRYESGRCRP
jgi:hypothetical protein